MAKKKAAAKKNVVDGDANPNDETMPKDEPSPKDVKAEREERIKTIMEAVPREVWISLPGTKAFTASIEARVDELNARWLSLSDAKQKAPAGSTVIAIRERLAANSELLAELRAMTGGVTKLTASARDFEKALKKELSMHYEEPSFGDYLPEAERRLANKPKKPASVSAR